MRTEPIAPSALEEVLDQVDVRVVDEVGRLQQVVQDVEVAVDQVVVAVDADPEPPLGAQHRLIHHRPEVGAFEGDLRRLPRARADTVAVRSLLRNPISTGGGAVPGGKLVRRAALSQLLLELAAQTARLAAQSLVGRARGHWLVSLGLDCGRSGAGTSRRLTVQTGRVPTRRASAPKDVRTIPVAGCRAANVGAVASWCAVHRPTRGWHGIPDETAGPIARPGRVLPAPDTGRCDCILHVGMGKTGTSSIQFFLRDNRERLGDVGVLFPATPGTARHQRLTQFVRTEEELANSQEWRRETQYELATFHKAFQQDVIAEIEQSGLGRVLLTDEVLFKCSDEALRRLAELTRSISDELRLVVYLRRQDDHLISRYQQEVKVGEILRLRVWAEQDMSDLYDYYARLQAHQRFLAPDQLVVRRYERDAFAGGSIYQDFLDAAGIELQADRLERGPDRNTGLDAESVEFLRVLNTYRVEYEGATPGLIDNRHLVQQLAEHTLGPVLSLPASRLDRFMAQWDESNERTARQFLGDPDGTLFEMPRRTEGVTTEQRLDPARLDHFQTLLDIPAQIHRDLRRIAEREARKG